MKRVLAHAQRELVALQRAALVRTSATVVTVDHTADPIVAVVRLTDIDDTTVAVEGYRHLSLEAGDKVDVDLSDTVRPRIRGVIAAPRWRTPTLENSWVEHTGTALVPLRWRLEPSRVLRLHGAVSGGSYAATVFTLPPEVWPSRPSMITVVTPTGPAVCTVGIDGAVAHFVDGSNSYMAFCHTVPL